MSPFVESLAYFALNLAIVFVIVRFIYYPQQHDKNYVFTFFALNAIVYWVVGLMQDSTLSLGAGFGLFAIFSILRYRTDTIPIREMTYLFVLIALPVVNSILIAQQALEQLLAANLAMVVLMFILERGWGFTYEARKAITYERIDLIRPENWEALMDDLKVRTGLPITRVEIGKLNFLRDSADLQVYYHSTQSVHPHVRFTSSHHLSPPDND
jgi:hypothetical protein